MNLTITPVPSRHLSYHIHPPFTQHPHSFLSPLHDILFKGCVEYLLSRPLFTHTRHGVLSILLPSSLSPSLYTYSTILCMTSLLSPFYLIFMTRQGVLSILDVRGNPGVSQEELSHETTRLRDHGLAVTLRSSFSSTSSSSSLSSSGMKSLTNAQ